MSNISGYSPQPDLVERLRDRTGTDEIDWLLDEAGAEIERLREELDGTKAKAGAEIERLQQEIERMRGEHMKEDKA